MCFNISLCECGCECARLQGRSGASVLVLCSSSQPTSAPPWGPPLPRAPRLAEVSLWYDADTLVCQGRGGGTQLSSSLQRQEEDGHGPPELWAGLVGHSTARHHHHCDRREGDSQAPVSLEDQGVAGRRAAVGGPVPLPPLSGDRKRTLPSKHIDTHQHGLEVCGVGVNAACGGPDPGSVAKTRKFTGPQWASVFSVK